MNYEIDITKFYTEQHKEILSQIEALQKQKEVLASETKTIDYLGDRKITVPKYSDWELRPLIAPIDSQIQELRSKLLTIPLKLDTRIIQQSPIVYTTLDGMFTIKWHTHKKQWYVAKTEGLVGIFDLKVKANEQNIPTELSFMWQSSETHGQAIPTIIPLIEQVDVTSPRVPIPKLPQAKIELPTWNCTTCARDNYAELLSCRFCGTAKPVDKQPEPQQEPEPSSKLRRIRDMFSKD